MRHRHLSSERRRHRQRRRAELLDAADRVIRRSGPAASMTAIAAEAGITKPILYRHFGDKGGLYQSLTERYVQALMLELRAAMAKPGGPRKRLATTIDAYLAFIEEHRDAYDFLMHKAAAERPEAQATITDFIRSLAEEVSDSLRSQLSSFGLDPRLAEPWAFGLVGMVHLAGDRWMETRRPSRAELVDSLTDLVWTGFSGLAEASQATG